ncbi:phosphate ABC transporter substrate-binding protein (PhoT family) [Humitalea rosea]|uniref:Phosphate-binding protein PstS n=1 Tax=Humitalea rosea TaxID=990373 RepID=A0A2W7IIW0_9PROT|nr:phosphate ABC transporter substrate-binding protein PstS [Humitalea rosea]PZW45119.1 phosphate ABC transporter substrate-binding protein (PhoT family) [Humitalea rosea]
MLITRRSALFTGAAALITPSFALAQGATITGAGASFPAPLYQKWAEAAKGATGITVNYQSVGSGAGQAQIRNRTVDFGATDAPMDPAQLDAGKFLQFPTVMGSIVAIVNLPGVADNQLKMTGEVLADIYLGKITKWNDARIVEMNAGVTLPNTAIAPVYRADGSGTTFVWVSYLSAVSSEFKEKVGVGTSVRWPTGNGARGNEGVAATVRNTRGAIGYVENAYATQNQLVSTQIRNKAGQFVTPNAESFLAAASNADWSVPHFAASVVDTQGEKSWPIVTPTFVVVPKEPTDAARALNTLKFFDWAYTSGDALSQQLEYIPLPAAVKASVREAWKVIKAPGGATIWTA